MKIGSFEFSSTGITVTWQNVASVCVVCWTISHYFDQSKNRAEEIIKRLDTIGPLAVTVAQQGKEIARIEKKIDIIPEYEDATGVYQAKLQEKSPQ